MLHGKLIRHQGDELAVGGLFLGNRYPAAESAVKGINSPPAPSHLDGMADGALDLAGAGIEAPRDRRVQVLGNAVDAIRLLDDQLDRLAQELIALDMRRNAKAEEDVAQPVIQCARGGDGQGGFFVLLTAKPRCANFFRLRKI